LNAIDNGSSTDTSPIWIYILIAAAVCCVFWLLVIVLFAIRRRRNADDDDSDDVVDVIASDVDSNTTYQSMASLAEFDSVVDIDLDQSSSTPSTNYARIDELLQPPNDYAIATGVRMGNGVYDVTQTGDYATTSHTGAKDYATVDN
jgi:hypothetical protein